MVSHTFLMILEHLVGAPSAPARVGMEIASFVRGCPSLPLFLFPHSHATFPALNADGPAPPTHHSLPTAQQVTFGSRRVG